MCVCVLGECVERYPHLISLFEAQLIVGRGCVFKLPHSLHSRVEGREVEVAKERGGGERGMGGRDRGRER